MSPRDILSFFQPFFPLYVEFVSLEEEEPPLGDTHHQGPPHDRVETCCVIFPSPAAATSAMEQRSSPCDLLLQRHKEYLQLEIRQHQELLEGEAEEGEVEEHQQHQQHQLLMLKEQLFNLNELQQNVGRDTEIRLCLDQLAKWRR